MRRGLPPGTGLAEGGAGHISAARLSGDPRHETRRHAAQPQAAGTMPPMTSGGWRRRATLARGAALLLPAGLSAGATETGWAALAAAGPDGACVLFRHAEAPGVGDPPGMRLDDCATQRNLDARGRAQARQIGEAFRAHGLAVGVVLHSAWCRAAETAALAFPGLTRVEPAFNSFFEARGEGAARTAAARHLLLGWAGPGALVAVTHQVNITALTGVVPASGEGVVLRRQGPALALAGRLRVPG